MTVAVLHHHRHVHQHGHSSVLSSVRKDDSAAGHCHQGEAGSREHRPEGDHPHVPAKHDDCRICQYLSNKPLATPSVKVAQFVEQITPVELPPLVQPPGVLLASYDCRAPPRAG